jgi:hypothetical protein
MTNSSASSATIIAVAVFENGRVAEGQGMTLIFDAQIYLGEDCPPLLAALRYFNSTNRAFNEIGFYFVIAKASPTVTNSNTRILNPFLRWQKWNLAHALGFFRVWRKWTMILLEISSGHVFLHFKVCDC